MKDRMEDPSCLEALKTVAVMAAVIYACPRDLTMEAAVGEAATLFQRVRMHVEARHKAGGKYARGDKGKGRRAAYWGAHALDS